MRLQGPGDQYTVKKFSGFLLVAEPADALSPETSAGSFQLVGDSLARFSEYCPHAVKHASELPKAEVQVRWTAPPATAGCVSFRQVTSHSIFTKQSSKLFGRAEGKTQKKTPKLYSTTNLVLFVPCKL